VWSSPAVLLSDTRGVVRERRSTQQPSLATVRKPTSEAVERIVEELMDCSLTKQERIQRLRELAKSGDDVPDELMDQALKKLMERLTE
jgi:uncharacterized membrane protein